MRASPRLLQTAILTAVVFGAAACGDSITGAPARPRVAYTLGSVMGTESFVSGWDTRGSAGTLGFGRGGGDVTWTWSVNSSAATPSNAEFFPADNSNFFLGRFANDTATLALSNLDLHDGVTVDFDLYIIGSWDGIDTTHIPGGGNLRWGGPDEWLMTWEGQFPAAICTSFANNNGASDTGPAPTQEFNGSGDPNSACGHGNSVPAGTGTATPGLFGSLGYLWDGAGTQNPSDAVYHFHIPIAHTGPTFSVTFFGRGLQGVADESWGIDNISVTIACAVPLNCA